VIRVDANAAWTAKHALRMIELLLDFDVEFVEQPLPAHDLEGIRFVRERSPLPIFADESCVVAADIPKLVGVVDGINIKLSKCGGLREALRMIATARAHGMLVMTGCMIESSLGITAAAHFAPLLDYADFDGAALLADDPYEGATIEGGQIQIPHAPGLGVAARAESMAHAVSA
jgi:L-alanine-DL-glutamate epimerase-like enolase superfamily enzyme